GVVVPGNAPPFGWPSFTSLATSATLASPLGSGYSVSEKNPHSTFIPFILRRDLNILSKALVFFFIKRTPSHPHKFFYLVKTLYRRLGKDYLDCYRFESYHS